jgi:outer membrane protein W
MSDKMKKILNWIIFGWSCAAFLGFHTGIARAGENFNRFSVGAIVAYHNTASSEIGDVDANFDTVPIIGLNGTVFINRSFAVEIETQYLKTDLNAEHDDKSGTLGDIRQTPVFLTFRYQHPIDKVKANIYLGLGANYSQNEFNQKAGPDSSDFFGVNVAADIKGSFGWHANVGTEWFFLEHFSAYLDLKAVFNEAEVELVYPDSTRETRDVALNASALGMGVKYYFF